LNLVPKLQRQDNFKDTISRLSRELALNRKFVSSSPQRPTLGSKKRPKQPAGFDSQRIQNIDPLLSIPGVPVHTEHHPNPTPQKFC
jgi:hypothetical protein